MVSYFLLNILISFLCLGTSTTATREANSHLGQNITLRQNVLPNPWLSNELQQRDFAASVGSFLGDKMLDNLITRFVELNQVDGFSCTVKITHNFVDRELVSPKVYLARGSTRTPPPYKIAPGYKDADKKFAIFRADDKIERGSFVTAGSMTYDIGREYVLIIVWSVVKNGKFLLGEGGNGFYFAVVKRRDIKSPWKESLKSFYDDAQSKMFKASTTERYVELVNKAADGKTVDFTIRAHMTNKKNGQLILDIRDPSAPATSSKRAALATAMGMTAVYTVLNTLSKMALRYLPLKTQSLVVTIQNDFTDTSLEDPQWHLKQVIISDYIPYEIPAEEERQITFEIPLGYTESKNPFDKTKHSAIMVTYRIKGTDNRLAFQVWWAKKFSLKEHNHYSVSIMHKNIDFSLFERITKERETTGGYQENILVASEYLDYQCKEAEIDAAQLTTGTPKKVKKFIRMAVTMGDSTASNMIVNIGDRKGNKLDILVPTFQGCQEKIG